MPSLTKKQIGILITFGLILLIEVIILSDYISPIQWGQLKVTGQACTCPDYKVLAGRIYLRSITPDSLKQYDIDYSEFYINNEHPSTRYDPMGVGTYIIKGEVVGKERVSKADPWNVVIRVDEWNPVSIESTLKAWFIFISTIIVMLFYLIRKNHKNN